MRRTAQQPAAPNVIVPAPCNTCIVGPVTFTRERGTPRSDTITFGAVGGQSYFVDMDDLNSQGADGFVELNGTTLVRGSALRFTGRATLSQENALVVRLAGKPGSVVRIAIWPVKPARLDAVTLPPGTSIQLRRWIGYDATVTNLTPSALFDVDLQAWIQQPSARRGAGRSVMFCGAGSGVLPPGTCVRSGIVAASNDSAGFGTLVPGPASALLQLRQSGTILDSIVVPIVLAPASAGVLSVSVAPASLMLLPGDRSLLAATVQADPGFPTTVQWASTNPATATVDAAGMVTALGSSGSHTTIIAFSTADQSKRDSAAVSVYDFKISEPATTTFVSTGVIQPPSNPVNVTIVARVCGPQSPTTFFPNPFDHVTFLAVTASGGLMNIGSSGSPVVVDNVSQTERCFMWSVSWTPGNILGVGTQRVFAAAYNFAGAVLHSPENTLISTIP